MVSLPFFSIAPIFPPAAREHLVEFGDGAPGPRRVRPDGADDGEEIGAGLDERPAILLRDAAFACALTISPFFHDLRPQ